MEVRIIKGKKFIVRENTLDEYVIKENCYDSCSFKKDDVWLDIGGNIGIFPIFYGHKVKQIISFEPEQQNCYIFKKHILLNNVQNSLLIEKAVISSDDTEVSFFLNTKKNKGAHSMFVKKGREEVVVPATNINKVIELYKPNKIKLDIEGGEYDLIKGIENWDNIQEFIFEFHINILKDHEGIKLKELYDILKFNGFFIKGKKPTELGKNWIIIVHCKKL